MAKQAWREGNLRDASDDYVGVVAGVNLARLTPVINLALISLAYSVIQLGGNKIPERWRSRLGVKEACMMQAITT